MESTET
jgi:hypothetical protein